MRISRRALLGSAGALVAGASALSLPGGGPRTFFGGTPPPHDFAPLGTMFSVAELRAELTWLVDTMREVGAKPFAFADETAFERAYRDRLGRFDRPANAREFFLIAAPLFAGMNDGHVSILLGHEYNEWRDRKGRAFGLLARLREHGLFVETETQSGFPPGTRIDAIDGTPSNALIEALVSLQGAQTLGIRRALIGLNTDYVMRQWFYARDGERSSYEVSATKPDGKRVTAAVATTTTDEVSRTLERAPKQTEANYTFSRIARGRVGYVDYRHCLDKEAFRQFLTQTFSGIKMNPVAGIVIDIRRNGGGDADVNDVLWPFVSNRPFSPGGRFMLKVSSRLKREYGFWLYNMHYFPPAWFLRDGSIAQFDVTRLAAHRPENNPLQFAGPVYLLIGKGTFSSAIGCAQEAKTGGLATIVGEETSPVRHTGEVYSGYSPRVGVAFGFTTKYYNDDPFKDGEGVVPDVTIVPTEADDRAGRDPVLDYAVDRILRHSAT
ncbi:MAG TPA: S41 family peptidase [Candidatus Baltobacteraceae bacterium]|jgi:hypothetical protein